MKKTILLIMAAGIGSRYGGGVKQLAKVDDHDHIIMDYSICDAMDAGFNKIVFIIRRDIEKDFKEVIGNRIEEICAKRGVEVAYCFQSLEDIPGEVPEGRTKPWGTGQAVLAAKEHIDAPFAVVNADDFYGKQAFQKVHDWLLLDHADSAICMAGFILKNTLSKNGGVTRGVCYTDAGHTHITKLVETKNIIINEKGKPEVDGVELDPDLRVSMNMWGFPAKEGEIPAFMNILESTFVKFFEKDVKENPLKAEYLLPILIGKMLEMKTCTIKELTTNDMWFGVTYAEDKAAVTENIRQLIDQGIYTEELF